MLQLVYVSGELTHVLAALSVNLNVYSIICLQYVCVFFQAMVEKLKSQLDAAQKAKESHAARKKLHETVQSKQVWKQWLHPVGSQTEVMPLS